MQNVDFPVINDLALQNPFAVIYPLRSLRFAAKTAKGLITINKPYLFTAVLLKYRFPLPQALPLHVLCFFFCEKTGLENWRHDVSLIVLFFVSTELETAFLIMSRNAGVL